MSTVNTVTKAKGLRLPCIANMLDGLLIFKPYCKFECMLTNPDEVMIANVV